MDQDARAWSSNDAVHYYSTHRKAVGDLYESEKGFLAKSVNRSRSVLDIGCAAGGFAAIVRQMNADIAYTGVDISESMIAKARERFPEDSFSVVDGTQLGYGDNSFDTCISLGVLHMTKHWPSLLDEAWRIAKQDVVFDLRLVETEGVSDQSISYQKLDFNGQGGRDTKVPYLVLNVKTLLSFLQELRPAVEALHAYGYFHPVSSMTVSPYKKVCMAVFRLSKIPASSVDGTPSMHWNLPISIEDDWLPRVSSESSRFSMCHEHPQGT